MYSSKDTELFRFDQAEGQLVHMQATDAADREHEQNAALYGNNALRSLQGIPIIHTLNNWKDDMRQYVQDRTPDVVRANVLRISSVLGIGATTTSVIASGYFHGGAINNPWRLMGVPYAYGRNAMMAYFPEPVETPEEIEQENNMTMPQYIAHRLKNCLDPAHHLYQTNGASWILYSFMQAMGYVVENDKKFRFLLFTAADNFISGLGFIFFRNPENGYQLANASGLIRMPASIAGATSLMFTASDANQRAKAPYILLGLGIDTLENVLGFFVGGSYQRDKAAEAALASDQIPYQGTIQPPSQPTQLI